VPELAEAARRPLARPGYAGVTCGETQKVYRCVKHADREAE
jgi:hypothetical protein